MGRRRAALTRSGIESPRKSIVSIRPSLGCERGLMFHDPSHAALATIKKLPYRTRPTTTDATASRVGPASNETAIASQETVRAVGPKSRRRSPVAPNVRARSPPTRPIGSLGWCELAISASSRSEDAIGADAGNGCCSPHSAPRFIVTTAAQRSRNRMDRTGKPARRQPGFHRRWMPPSSTSLAPSG